MRKLINSIPTNKFELVMDGPLEDLNSLRDSQSLFYRRTNSKGETIFTGSAPLLPHHMLRKHEGKVNRTNLGSWQYLSVRVGPRDEEANLDNLFVVAGSFGASNHLVNCRILTRRYEIYRQKGTDNLHLKVSSEASKSGVFVLHHPLTVLIKFEEVLL